MPGWHMVKIQPTSPRPHPNKIASNKLILFPPLTPPVRGWMLENNCEHCHQHSCQTQQGEQAAAAAAVVYRPASAHVVVHRMVPVHAAHRGSGMMMVMMMVATAKSVAMSAVSMQVSFLLIL